MHGGGGKQAGAAEGNQYNLKHGFYAQSDLPEECTIDGLIDNAYQRHVQLDRYIDQVRDSGQASVREMISLFRLHGLSTGRLSQLLRDQRELSEDADSFPEALGLALDSLSEEWGVKL